MHRSILPRPEIVSTVSGRHIGRKRHRWTATWTNRGGRDPLGANTMLKIRMVAGPQTGPTPLARKVMNATIRWPAAVVALKAGLQEALLADLSATFVHRVLSSRP